MSDMFFQFQNINFQLKNISTQFENAMAILQNMGINNVLNQLENMGIQMMNMAIQILNTVIDNKMMMMGMDNSNIYQSIQIIKSQINNIEMKTNMNNINPMAMNNMMGMMPNNIMNNMNMMEPMNDNNESNVEKMDIIFKTTSGTQKRITFKYGTTVGEVLKKYLKEVGRPELIGRSDRIAFVYNLEKLSFDDQSKIEEKFSRNITPKILVNDPMYLIGG